MFMFMKYKCVFWVYGSIFFSLHSQQVVPKVNIYFVEILMYKIWCESGGLGPVVWNQKMHKFLEKPVMYISWQQVSFCNHCTSR